MKITDSILSNNLFVLQNSDNILKETNCLLRLRNTEKKAISPLPFEVQTYKYFQLCP